MKLEDPLLNLIGRCQTLCDPECCGIDAYDFSPIHIASFLIMWEGKPNEIKLTELYNQLESLKSNYGSNGTVSDGVELDEMNQGFSGTEIDKLVDEISYNLKIALKLCGQSDLERHTSTEPVT